MYMPEGNAPVITQSMDTLTNESTPLWFAMSATFGRAMKAKAYLESHDVQCFVPMRYEIAKDRKHGTTRKLVPAINNLLFVHTTRERIQQLKSATDYLQYHTRPLNGRNIPITVPEYQMQQFMAVCDTLSDHLRYLSPDEVDLAQGTPVKIVGGTFDGIEGTFLRVETSKRRQVVIMVQGIAAVMLAKITDGFIQPLSGE